MFKGCGMNCNCQKENSDYLTKINIKYFDDKMPRIEKINIGDWIDLRVRDIIKYNDKRTVFNYNTKTFKYKSFEFLLVKLGVAMKLPEGFEALTAPRGSTFKYTGLIQTNSPGVVDNSYCGDNDEWFIPCYSLSNGEVELYQRICQFRLMPTMNYICKDMVFTEVDKLEDKSRGGHGSTGKN